MKLLFYDKFFDALINLPKGTQKKVIEFQKKFRDNSKTASIHLEPIAACKDKSLRSARVDQTYRAIIKAPTSGDIYYLLWVDHHDDAYAWAMNKMFQWNDDTQSMQMFTAPEVIQEHGPTKSLKEINSTFFSKIGKDKLIRIGVPEVLMPSINQIDTIDDLAKVEKYIPADVFENLFYLLDGANIDSLITDVEDGKVDEKEDIINKVGSINNQRSFIELTDDTLFNEVLDGSLQKWKYYLHPSQRKLVSSQNKGPMKVSGGAGTGKTVVALHRLKYLAQQLQSAEKILFTTYTNALTENLKELIKGFEIDMSKVTLSNIDGIVKDLVSKYDLLPKGYKVFEFSSVKTATDIWEDLISSELTSYSPEFLDTEYKDVILYHDVKSLEDYIRTSRVGRGKPISRRQRKEIWEFFEKFNEIRSEKKIYFRDELFNILSSHLKENEIYPYDYCLVDELQDLSNVELRLIRYLVKEKANDLFMVGDPMQRVYDRRITFSKVGINVRGKRSKRLRINYRTTEEIKKLAMSVIEDCHYDNFDGEEEERAGYISLFHGNRPIYTIHKTKGDEINAVLEYIEQLIESKYNYSEIAICSRTKDGLKDFRNALHQNGLPYTDKDSGKSKTEDSMSLLTFHKVKGLEFKHVILVDVNHRTLPKLPFDFDSYSDDEKASYLKKEKSLVYVAVSRAIESVYITGIGQESKHLKV